MVQSKDSACKQTANNEHHRTIAVGNVCDVPSSIRYLLLLQSDNSVVHFRSRVARRRLPVSSCVQFDVSAFFYFFFFFRQISLNSNLLCLSIVCVRDRQSFIEYIQYIEYVKCEIKASTSPYQSRRFKKKNNPLLHFNSAIILLDLRRASLTSGGRFDSQLREECGSKVIFSFKTSIGITLICWHHSEHR